MLDEIRAMPRVVDLAAELGENGVDVAVTRGMYGARYALWDGKTLFLSYAMLSLLEHEGTRVDSCEI